jgi:hypothetical protein
VDLKKDDKIRLTTLRLYRILQRTCKEFDNDKLQPGGEILLQPNLEAPDWGRHATYTPPKPTQTEELYRLFYVWNDSVDEQAVFRSSNHDYYYDDSATPSSKTTATTSNYDNNTAPYMPSSIDDWYYELVSKRKQQQADTEGEDASSSSSSSSSSLPPMTSMTCWASQSQLQEAVRTAFRTLQYDDSNRSHKNYDEDQSSTSLLRSSDLHKWAIRAIQILQEQQTLWRHSSVATTNGIKITATSRCIGTTAPTPTTIPPSITTPQILADAAPKYRFAYRIRVENVSDDQTIQLMGRYWHIAEEPEGGTTNESPAPIEVDSPVTGAVGQLPVLQPVSF